MPTLAPTQAPSTTLKHLTEEQVASYLERGFLHIPQVFSPSLMEAMDHDLMVLINNFAQATPGWTGPWRKAYMDEETEQKSKLVAMHDLQLYSQAWCQAVTHKILCDSMQDLLGKNVELHHSTLHAKPPESGHPFPMHQDWAFYKHQDNRYVDVLVHLDDTNDENGCIRFLEGSHKGGALEHITQTPEGACTPHLPTDQYSLKDTVPVPARRGDIVVFNLFTIHGSYINRTDKIRRLVRVGFRNPENIQTAGQSKDRPGLMVRGLRPKGCGSAIYNPLVIEE